jgi:UDP-N-acetylmuramyl pentapeptide phosphotransferase/UDP-N-acetylglucosamine-1-phosphate transferase
VSGAALIAVVSWLDDLRSLPNWVRFAAHSLGAVFAILGFGYWGSMDLPLLGAVPLGWLGLIITFLWIVGLTNAYNFMDGIDGIAAGQAIVAGLGWTILGWSDNQPLVVALGLLLAASSLGFLRHNWSPARIFMGDVGSAFLGYTFAVLPVVMAQYDPRFALAGVLLVWPFVFDTVFTILRRLYNRENVFTAHRSHLYQRLVATGFSHKVVASLYIGLAIIGLVCSVALVMEWRWADYLTVIIIIVAPLILWLGTRWRECSVSKTANSQ